MTLASSLYVGSVLHRRLRPRRHDLRYRVFWLLVDLAELDRLDARLKLFAHNRRNLFALHDRDYGDGSGRPLADQVGAHLQEAGIEADGRILLLTMPRVLGYAFNPLSVYFCHRDDGSLAAILYEVHNTFGERHSYLAPVGDQASPVQQTSAKTFHVSPFLGMAMRYAFRVTPPGERVAVAIEGRDADGPVIAASLTGERREISDAALLRLVFSHPLLTVKVVAAIHWHALLMLLKGFGINPHPPAPERAVTIGRPGS